MSFSNSIAGYGQSAGFKPNQWPQNWVSGLSSVGAYNTPGASNPVGALTQNRASQSNFGLNYGGGSSSGISGIGNNLVKSKGSFGGGAAGGGGSFLGRGGGGELILGGLQLIGNLWGAWQANKIAKEQNRLAREQFEFQKTFATKNMANQIQSYNTTLEDRSYSRAHTQNEDRSTAETYIQKHRLPEFKG